MARELGNGDRLGGFDRLHRLPTVETVKGAGFGEMTTSSRSLRGVVREGSAAGTYDVTQEIGVRNKTTFLNRYTIVRSLGEGDQATAVFENGRLLPTSAPSPEIRRLNVEIAEQLKAAFNNADEFHVTDPAIIARMDPTERALRELYKVSESDLDPSETDSTTYGIFGDLR